MDYDVLVSVIIPFYKNKVWLKKAINSVYSGSYQNFEIILVNDGSTESLDDIIHEYDDRLRLINQDNSGAAIARNSGIKKAKGTYVAFLDSDDYWLQDKLELQVEYMEQNNMVWSHTGYANFIDGTEDFTDIDVVSLSENIYPRCLYSSKIATPCVMIKREVLSDYFSFPYDMRRGQDVILWFKLASCYPLGLINKRLSCVRKTGTNASQDVIVQIIARYNFWNKIKQFDKDKLAQVKGIGRISYVWCGMFGRFIKNINGKVPRWLVKLLAIILYAPAHVGFKIALKLKDNSRER